MKTAASLLLVIACCAFSEEGSSPDQEVLSNISAAFAGQPIKWTEAASSPVAKDLYQRIEITLARGVVLSRFDYDKLTEEQARNQFRALYRFYCIQFDANTALRIASNRAASQKWEEEMLRDNVRFPELESDYDKWERANSSTTNKPAIVGTSPGDNKAAGAPTPKPKPKPALTEGDFGGGLREADIRGVFQRVYRANKIKYAPGVALRMTTTAAGSGKWENEMANDRGHSPELESDFDKQERANTARADTGGITGAQPPAQPETKRDLVPAVPSATTANGNTANAPSAEDEWQKDFKRRDAENRARNARVTDQKQRVQNQPGAATPTAVSDEAKQKRDPASAAKVKGLASMMRNYLNAHDLAKAKDYAKKVVDQFPDSVEAKEAQAVLAVDQE